MESADSTTQRVLIVDDSEQITELLAAWLSDLAAISIAHNVDDALQAVLVTKPDVLLVDIVMPGRSGFDLIDALKRQPGGLESRVIFMTGLQEPANTYRAMELGATTVLHKPLDPEQLRHVVSTSLHSASA